MRSEKCYSGVDIKRGGFFRVGKINKINFLQVSIMFSEQKNVKSMRNTLNQNVRT